MYKVLNARQVGRCPAPGARSAPEPRDPLRRVNMANAAARVQPSRSGYVNAVQVFPFADGALYQIYAAPGQVTDIRASN